MNFDVPVQPKLRSHRDDDSNVRQNTTINQEYNKYIGGDGGGGGGVK